MKSSFLAHVFAQKLSFDVTAQLEDGNITVPNLCNSATTTKRTFFVLNCTILDATNALVVTVELISTTIVAVFCVLSLRNVFLSFCGRKFFVRSRTFNEYFNVRKGDPTSGDQQNTESSLQKRLRENEERRRREEKNIFLMEMKSEDIIYGTATWTLIAPEKGRHKRR